MVVSSFHPAGMLVRKCAPMKGRGAGVGVGAEEMLALGVTVAAGDPHAMRSRVARQAPAPSARVPTEDKVTASRIAEPSHMSSRRSGDNRSHGDTLRAPGVTAGAGT